jgi:hypothetical protein
MEQYSLHPFSESEVAEFVAAILNGRQDLPPIRAAIAGYADAMAGKEAGTYRITHSLALYLAMSHPSFVFPGLSLSAWEARIDRGIGMMMRPPSRLFVDAGLEPSVSRMMPIRLDPNIGMMGGAWIPARLMDQVIEELERKRVRIARRLVEGEIAELEIFVVMMEAAQYAQRHGLGLYEGVDVIEPTMPMARPPDARVFGLDRSQFDQVLIKQLRAESKPPKEPGRIARMLGRDRAVPRLTDNGTSS